MALANETFTNLFVLVGFVATFSISNACQLVEMLELFHKLLLCPLVASQKLPQVALDLQHGVHAEVRPDQQ